MVQVQLIAVSVILLLAKKEHFVTLSAVVLMHFFVVQFMHR